MAVSITNNSKALQGVHTTAGLVFIAPGATRDGLDLAEDHLKSAQRLQFLDISDEASEAAPKEEGEAPPPFDPEMIPAMSDDELRAHITARDGKAPHHALGREKLEALAKAPAEA